MIRRLLPLAALLPLLAAGDDPFAGRVAGKPQRCITLSQLQGPVIVDAQTIYYRDGSRLWRTGPRGTCPSLRPFTTLITEVYGGQLCSGDRFRTRDPGLSIPSAACLFGDFVPYTPAPE